MIGLDHAHMAPQIGQLWPMAVCMSCSCRRRCGTSSAAPVAAVLADGHCLTVMVVVGTQWLTVCGLPRRYAVWMALPLPRPANHQGGHRHQGYAHVARLRAVCRAWRATVDDESGWRECCLHSLWCAAEQNALRTTGSPLPLDWEPMLSYAGSWQRSAMELMATTPAVATSPDWLSAPAHTTGTDAAAHITSHSGLARRRVTLQQVTEWASRYIHTSALSATPLHQPYQYSSGNIFGACTGIRRSRCSA